MGRPIPPHESWWDELSPRAKARLVRQIIVGGLLALGTAFVITGLQSLASDHGIWASDGLRAFLFSFGSAAFAAGLLIAVPPKSWRAARQWNRIYGISYQHLKSEWRHRQYAPRLELEEQGVKYEVGMTGVVIMCSLSFRVFMTPRYPYANTRLRLSGPGVVRIRQKRPDADRPYVFSQTRLSATNFGVLTTYDAEPGKSYLYTLEFDYMHQPPNRIYYPDLTKDYDWELKGLSTEASGPSGQHFASKPRIFRGRHHGA